MNSVQSVHHASQEAWRDLTTARTFDPFEIHVTSLESCLRQLHFRATGEAITDPDTSTPSMKIAAHEGTAIDALYVPYFAAAWAKTDPTLEVVHPHFKLRHARDGVAIIGESDVVAFGPDNTAQVWDLKTCEYSKWDACAAGEIPDAHALQVICYARLIELQTGRRVTDMHLYYLDRSDPEAYKDFRRSARYFTTSQTFTDADRQMADTLFDRVFSAAKSTAEAPRWFGDERGKISSRFSPCHKCLWQTRCLGKPVHGQDATLAVDVEAAGQLIGGWAEARTDKAEAVAKLKDFIRAELDKNKKSKVEGRLKELVIALNLDRDFYDAGNGTVLELYDKRGGEIKDQEAIEKILSDLGIKIPTKPRADSPALRIRKDT